MRPAAVAGATTLVRAGDAVAANAPPRTYRACESNYCGGVCRIFS